jgi:hypothetical protein
MMVNEVKTNFEKEVVEPISEASKLNKLEDDEEYEYITIPPDGGYGWVVLIACFVSNYIEEI